MDLKGRYYHSWNHLSEMGDSGILMDVEAMISQIIAIDYGSHDAGTRMKQRQLSSKSTYLSLRDNTGRLNT